MENPLATVKSRVRRRRYLSAHDVKVTGSVSPPQLHILDSRDKPSLFPDHQHFYLSTSQFLHLRAQFDRMHRTQRWY